MEGQDRQELMDYQDLMVLLDPLALMDYQAGMASQAGQELLETMVSMEAMAVLGLPVWMAFLVVTVTLAQMAPMDVPALKV
jgi:hypothetical protein